MSFKENLEAIEAELDKRTAEIERTRNEWYRARAEHERFVNALYAQLKAEKHDEALDMVRAEYDAIHGPNE